jgi:hypothetical protein
MSGTLNWTGAPLGGEPAGCHRIGPGGPHEDLVPVLCEDLRVRSIEVEPFDSGRTSMPTPSTVFAPGQREPPGYH